MRAGTAAPSREQLRRLPGDNLADLQIAGRYDEVLPREAGERLLGVEPQDAEEARTELIG